MISHGHPKSELEILGALPPKKSLYMEYLGPTCCIILLIFFWVNLVGKIYQSHGRIVPSFSEKGATAIGFGAQSWFRSLGNRQGQGVEGRGGLGVKDGHVGCGWYLEDHPI